jgi:hypothetical protein
MFEVQTRIGNAWENVWTEDDAPLTFAALVDAEVALLDFLTDCLAAGIEVYKKDFRIRPTA